MPIEREVIRQNITAKGFREDASKHNRDHDYFHFYYKGKKSHIWIKLSRGTSYREYSDNLLGWQAKILGVTKKDFEKFALCFYTEKEFINLLINNGKLEL